MLLTGSPSLKTKHSRNLGAGLEPCTVASSTCSAHPLLATSGPKALQRATYATCSTPCCALPFWQKPCIKGRVFQPSAQLLCLLLDLLCPNPEHTADNHSTLHKPHLCCLLLQLLCPGPEAVPLADQHPQHGMLPLVGPLCCLLSRHARRCCKSEPQVIGGQGWLQCSCEMESEWGDLQTPQSMEMGAFWERRPLGSCSGSLVACATIPSMFNATTVKHRQEQAAAHLQSRGSLPEGCHGLLWLRCQTSCSRMIWSQERLHTQAPSLNARPCPCLCQVKCFLLPASMGVPPALQ